MPILSEESLDARDEVVHGEGPLADQPCASVLVALPS
jgi:hypothetical protein